MVLAVGTTAEAYSRAMSAFTVGRTIKITGRDRHPEVDDFLVRHCDLGDAVIVDIGASDGSTSVDLIERLKTFRHYVMADLFNAATHVEVGKHGVFLDHENQPIVVVGRGLVAWPAASRSVGVLYSRVVRQAQRRRSEHGTEVPLLNPRARQVLAEDLRVTMRQHDLFQPWEGPRPDVIKVANVLRRLYFSDEDIQRGLRVLLEDLPDGGHLLIADNARAVPPVAARGALYQRRDGRFHTVAETSVPVEIDDLVLEVREHPVSLTAPGASVPAQPGPAQPQTRARLDG